MARKIEFEYFPDIHFDNLNQPFVVHRPKISIKLINNRKTSISFLALVDSGSDRNLFPATLGEDVGLKIKTGLQKQIFGIGGHELQSFTHQVTIILKDYSFKTEVDFSFDQDIPLLGREGFFNHFKRIDFKQNKKKIIFRI
jgi:hypothetical protein